MRFLDGGAEGDRTLDLRLAKPALSQLSYGPIEPCTGVKFGCVACPYGGPGKI